MGRGHEEDWKHFENKARDALTALEEANRGS
jgi:hypothetical protein